MKNKSIREIKDYTRAKRKKKNNRKIATVTYITPEIIFYFSDDSNAAALIQGPHFTGQRKLVILPRFLEFVRREFSCSFYFWVLQKRFETDLLDLEISKLFSGKKEI